MPCTPQCSTSSSNLLTNNPPQSFLKRFIGTMNVLPQRVVDKRLIVSASGALYFAAKPAKDVSIQPDGDPLFKSRNGVTEMHAMFRGVGAGLGRIPLVPHSVSICTRVHTSQWSTHCNCPR